MQSRAREKQAADDSRALKKIHPIVRQPLDPIHRSDRVPRNEAARGVPFGEF
jgi:hypothetical protein